MFLEKMNEKLKLERLENNDGVAQLYNKTNEPLALPLSAFQKELEEAANEPLFDCKQSEADEESSEHCCSETTSSLGIDESENLNPIEEDVFKPKEETVNLSANSGLSVTTSVLTERQFLFATPTANKQESKNKYTPSLTKIREYTTKKLTISNEILQTPDNNLLLSKARNLRNYNVLSTDKRQISTISSTKVKYDNSKMNKISKDTPQPLFEDMQTNEKGCIKQLSFNTLITPTISRRVNKPLETPKVQCSIDLNSMKTGGILNSAQKSKAHMLDIEKKCRLLSEDKKVNEIKPNEGKQKHEKLVATTGANSIPTGKRGNSLDDDKNYLHSLNGDTKKTDDGKSPHNKIMTNENVSNGLCTISGGHDLKQFDTIVVNNIKYIVLNELGKGGSSVVYHCYNPLSKTQRAIKKVTLKGDKACVQGYINEVKMLHKLQSCDRIIKMYSYEILKSEKVLYMVLEKGERDLSSILKDLSVNTTHLPMYMLIYYWMEMLFAVKQIHENGIIHSDLKPANFLVARGGLKLIDFGIASTVQTDMTSVVKNVQIGSFNYISPEAVQNNSRDSKVAEFKISYKSDVWSLGCILYQLVYRKTPFQHIGHMFAKLSAILDPNKKINYPNADWVPPKIIETIKACLKHEMRERPSVDELIKQYDSYF